MKAILINKTDELGHHGCTLANRQIATLAAKEKISFTEMFSLHSNWERANPKTFDAVIVNGEGTLHSSSKGAERIAQVPAWATKIGKRCYLINSVFQNNSDEIIKKISGFDLIFAQDRWSAADLGAHGIDAEVVPDLSLTWQTPAAPASGATIINGSTIKQLRRELFLLATTERQYIPIVAQPEGRSRRIEYSFKRLLALLAPPGLWRSRYRNAIPKFEDFVEFLRTNASGIITGRFHMVTIALCLEIPIVCISSNTHKIEALLEELQLTNRLTRSASPAPALLKPYTPQELERIRSLRRMAAQKARQMFKTIAQTDLA